MKLFIAGVAIGAGCVLSGAALMLASAPPCVQLTKAEQEAIWRASMLTASLANDWRTRQSQDAQHMVAFWNRMSDTLYDLQQRCGCVAGKMVTR